MGAAAGHTVWVRRGDSTRGRRGRLGPVNSRRRPRAERRLLFSGVFPLAVALLGAALGYVWLQLHVTELAYRLSTMRQVVDKLEIEQRELELEVASAEAPAQLKALARSLGMRPAWAVEEVRP